MGTKTEAQITNDIIGELLYIVAKSVVYWVVFIAIQNQKEVFTLTLYTSIIALCIDVLFTLVVPKKKVHFISIVLSVISSLIALILPKQVVYTACIIYNVAVFLWYLILLIVFDVKSSNVSP